MKTKIMKHKREQNEKKKLYERVGQLKGSREDRMILIVNKPNAKMSIDQTKNSLQISSLNYKILKTIFT